MTILLLNQFFYPDSAATSQLLTDLARVLASKGHAVRVICAGKPYAACGAEEPPPVQIVRTAGPAFGHGTAARVFSGVFYLCGALCQSFLGPKPDLILTLTTPPGLGLIGSLVKSVSGARHFSWEMDLYPDIAIDLGVLSKNSWFTRLVGKLLDDARRRADGIIALGEPMRARLIARGVPAQCVHVAENWVDGSEIYPLPFPEHHPFTVLYSGNLGLAHDIDTIRSTIQHFGFDRRFRFAFAGGGTERKAIESFCREHALNNAVFANYRGRHELTQTIGTCHVGLVTQKAVALGSVVPSKTYGLMAAGRPVLYIGPRQATPARIIGNFHCGWQIDPGDTDTLIALLEHLEANPAIVREAGARGRLAFLQHYDLPIGVSRICAILGASQLELSRGIKLGAT